MAPNWTSGGRMSCCTRKEKREATGVLPRFTHSGIRDLRLEVRLAQVYVPPLNDKQFKEKSNSPQTS